MKYAICNELFQDIPWDQALEMTSEHGYTGWEIAPFTLGERPTETTANQRSDFALQITEAGIEVVGLHWLLAKTEGFHLTTDDAEVRQRTADYLGDLAELCRDLGGSVMVLGSPQQRNFPDTMTHDQAAANAKHVVEMTLPILEKFEVTLALEPLGPGEGNFWNEAAQAVQVIEALNSPNVKLHLDVKAMSSEPHPIAEVIQANAGHMVHFHANDPNLLGPGMGEVDFVPIVQALKEVQYTGWVSVEVFDYAPGAEKILSESMRNMKEAAAATA